MSLGRFYRRIVIVPQGLFDPDQVNVIEVSVELRDEPVVIAAAKNFQIGGSIASLELITHNYSSDKIRPKTADAYVDHKAEVKEAETYVRTSGQRLKFRNKQSQTLGDRAVKKWLNCFSSADENDLVVNTVSQVNTIVLGDANSSSSCSGFLTPYDVEIMLSCMSNMNLPIGDEDTSTPDGQDMMMMIPMQQVLSRITEASEYTHTAASSPKETDDNYNFEANSSRSSTSEVSFTIVPPTNARCEIGPTISAHDRLANISSPIVVAKCNSKEVVFKTEDHQTSTTDFAAETSSESFATTAGSTKAIRTSSKYSATETQEAVEKKICCTQISSGQVKEVRCDIELYLKEVENVEIRQLHRDLTNYQLARRRCFLGCHESVDGMNERESNFH